MRVLLLSLLGCTSTSAVATDAGPVHDAAVEEAAVIPVVTATLRPVPNNVITAVVDVAATAGSRVVVEYGDTTAYGSARPAVDVPGDGKVSVVVPGLTQKSVNHLRVTATLGGIEARTTDLPFTSGALPFDISQTFDVPVTSPGLTGYFCIAIANLPAKIALNVIVDRRGKIVWYAPSTGRYPEHFEKVRGRFLMSDADNHTFVERDLLGNVALTWKNSGGTLDAHDFFDLGGGRALLMGWDYHTYDSSKLFADGIVDAQRSDHTIDEVGLDGKSSFHFTTYPQITFDELIEDKSGVTKINPKDTEFAHMNSLEVMPDGNILASLRATSSILKIDRKTSTILYRLGGTKSDFKFVDDPIGGFSMQHDPHWVAEKNELFVYDNGNNHAVPESRVVRYAIDEASKTAKLVWSYSHVPPIFSPFAGNARVLPNGNLYVSYAKQGVVTEIDPTSKKVVWELSLKYFGLYRALYTPTLDP